MSIRRWTAAVVVLGACQPDSFGPGLGVDIGGAGDLGTVAGPRGDSPDLALTVLPLPDLSPPPPLPDMSPPPPPIPAGVWTQTCSGTTGAHPCPTGEDNPFFRAFNYNLPYAANRKSLLYYGAYHNPSSIYSNAIWEYSTTTHRFLRLSWSGSTTYSCPGPGQDGVEPNSPYWDGHPMGSFVYDPSRGAVLVTQLLCQGYLMRHTWMMDTTTLTWKEAGSGVYPPETVDAAMAYDPDHDLFVSYGGAGTTVLAYFDPKTNSWINHTLDQSGAGGDADLPGYLGASKLFHDPVGHRMYLFGGYRSLGDGNSGVNDLWSLDVPAQRFTKVAPVGGVKPPAGSSGQYPWAVFDPGRRRIVDYVGPDNLWQYDVGENRWSQLSVPGGPPIPNGSGQPGYYGGTAGLDPGNDTLVVIRAPEDGNGNGGSPDVWELRFQP